MSFPPLPASLTYGAVHARLGELQAELSPGATSAVYLLARRDGTWGMGIGLFTSDLAAEPFNRMAWWSEHIITSADTDSDLLTAAMVLVDLIEDEASQDLAAEDNDE